MTLVSIAAAEVARPVRYLNIPLGPALMAASFMFGADMVTTAVGLILGTALAALSIRRGPVRERYGNWIRWIV
jgi:hypothetical protein